ncbi:MAG: hypothetical protein M1828_001640 [Chrysothrix sp. TS-e1954]|nr:MAG: hypothetical protein M1828_001640 [Chrysothrix sp. TS-e1954]
MSTEFITSLPPPGNLLSGYDRTKPHKSQPAQAPATFHDVMSVREEVFVKEQSVPLENEFEADDPRSWHWVTYASVGASHGSSSASKSASNDLTCGSGEQQRGHRRQSSSGPKDPPTSSRLAVGTVRLVPPPHPPHPEPGSTHQIDNSEASASAPASPKSHSGRRQSDSKAHSSHNPHNEPYIKLGRLAILKPYRKLGLAKLLVDAALEWAAQHPEDMVPHVSATDREARRMSEGSGDGIGEGHEDDLSDERWQGLVLCHSQKHLEGLYKKWGFARDKSLGEWDEEGIAHIGMWRRIKVKDRTGRV